MTSQQIRCVLTVQEERSISRAAKRLYMTQPSLSRYIISLEEELGVKLFDRSTSPLRLTTAGELYVRAAKSFAETESVLEQQLDLLRRYDTTELRIGMPRFRAQCYLPSVFAKFKSTHSGVKVYINTDKMSILTKNLQDGLLDFILGPRPTDGQGLAYEELSTEQIFLAANRDCPAITEGDPCRVDPKDIIKGVVSAPMVDLSRFANEEFISFRDDVMLSRVLQSMCSEAGFSPNIILYSSNSELAHSIVQQGCGCTMVFTTHVRLARFDVHPVYYLLSPEIWSVGATYKKSSPPGKTAKDFIDLYKEEF